MRLKSFLPGIIWFIISVVLLTLPGDNLPDTGLFDIPYFDKYVHFGMFSGLTFLFCYPFAMSDVSPRLLIKNFIQIAIYSTLYGIAMEYVQKYFVRGRSFDLTDIVFDTLGSLAGVFSILILRSRQKIGPDRNRGRNQN